MKSRLPGFLLVAALAGCSTESTPITPPPPPPPGNDGGPPPMMEAGVPLDEPTLAASYSMKTTLHAGQEIQRCQFLAVPKEGMHLNRATMQFTKGSHHVVLYLTSYTADNVPTVDRQGIPRDTTGAFECPYGPGNWDTVRGLTGAGSGDLQDIVSLPLDVALTLPPGALLLLNSHYINTTFQSLDVEVDLSLYGVPAAQVKQEAGFASFPDNYIHVPPGSKSSTHMRCPITKDITMLMAGGHMHKHGVSFVADLVDEHGAKVEELYSTTDWENVKGQWMEPGRQIKAGYGVDFRCDYVNPTAADVFYGQTTANEMCVLLSMYYPWDPALDYCASPSTPDDRGSAGVFFGTGTATCKATMDCLLVAKPMKQDQGEATIACLQASCPQAADAVSGFLQCQQAKLVTDCDNVCHTSVLANTCQQCLVNQCGAQVTACNAATCG